jgi:hypothetical protein
MENLKTHSQKGFKWKHLMFSSKAEISYSYKKIATAHECIFDTDFKVL